MKFLIIVILAVFGFTRNQVVCDTSSSEEVYSDESDENQFGDLFATITTPRPNPLPTSYPHHNPHVYPPPHIPHVYPQYNPHMYPPHYPPHYPNPHFSNNPNCNICHAVVTYIRQHGGNSSVNRNKSLKIACVHIGPTNSYACKSFTQTYGQEIVRVTRAQSNPTSICHSLHVC